MQTTVTLTSRIHLLNINITQQPTSLTLHKKHTLATITYHVTITRLSNHVLHVHFALIHNMHATGLNSSISWKIYITTTININHSTL